MPTPQGHISTSDVWRQHQEDNPPQDQEEKDEPVQVPAEEVSETER